MARPHPRKISKARRERMAEALELAEGGATYRQIAKVLKISLAQAKYDVDDALDAITREPAERLITLWNARLERLWFIAYNEARVNRDINAVDKCVKIADRAARLNGLDGAGSLVGSEVGSKLDELLREAPVDYRDEEDAA